MPTVTDSNSLKPSTWPDDLLRRDIHAHFLERFILARFKLPRDRNSLCLTIDGDWGAGKTFFIKKWQDSLRQNDHPIVHFDAWANDLSDDPLVGFISSFQEQLKPWIDKMPVADNIKNSAKKKWATVVKNAGKAIIPAGKVLATGVGKKLLAVDLDELIEATKASELSEDSVQLASESAKTFLDNALKIHESKRQAILDLRTSLCDLLQFLEKQTKAQPPMFVFIDELDRCRPDYAIRLLEGVKHIFDVEGICFVAATNLEQLSEATKAIYGSGFDSTKYLKRFFDFDYRLPDPNYYEYAMGIVAKSSLATREIASGLPSPTKSIHENFAVVARAFSLDLRSQKQLLLYAEAAAASLPANRPIYAIPLFFFSALALQSRKLFDTFDEHWGNKSMPEKALAPLPLKNLPIKYFERSPHDRSQIEKSTSVEGIMRHYFSTLANPLKEIQSQYWSSNNQSLFPERLNGPIAEEANGTGAKESILLKYPSLVRMAGQIS